LNGSNGNGASLPDLKALLGRNGKGNGTHAQASTGQIKQTSLAQPLAFAVEYALAKQLMHWGIHPQALLGYSLGEYVAACLAGVFSLEDAVTLVARRAQLISEMEEGAMMTVSLSEEALRPSLNGQVSLAVLNDPKTCVLSGPVAAIDQLAA